MYEIGQIVYALLEDKRVLIPVKIIEEITVKNLESESITYKVLVPNKKNQKVNLDKFDEVFVTTDDATDYLLSKAKSAIDDLMLDAIEMEENAFKVRSYKSPVEQDACNNENSSVNIELDDGTKAKINIDNLKQHTENLNINSEENLEESTSTWRI